MEPFKEKMPHDSLGDLTTCEGLANYHPLVNSTPRVPIKS